MAPVQRTGTVQDSLASYLQSIARYPLLGADQEILLAKQVRDLAELRRLKPHQLTPQLRRRLVPWLLLPQPRLPISPKYPIWTSTWTCPRA